MKGLDKKKRVVLAFVVGLFLVWFLCLLAVIICPLNAFSRPDSPLFVRQLFAFENYNYYDPRLAKDLSILIPRNTSEKEVDYLLVDVAGATKNTKPYMKDFRIVSYSRKLSGIAYQFKAWALPSFSRSVTVKYNKDNKVENFTINGSDPVL